MKFLLFLFFSVEIFGHFTKNQKELDEISDYVSNLGAQLMYEYGGRGKFAIYTANEYYIADKASTAHHLCEILPIPCIVDIIANDTYFIGISDQPDTMFTTSLSQTKFEQKLHSSWIPKKTFIVSKLDNSISESVLFVVDSGASISYLSHYEKARLNFSNAECKFWLPISGIVKSTETLCVVEIVIEINGKKYQTFAQLGNLNTVDTNLLGRFKFFDYFKICLKSKKKTEFILDVKDSEVKQIKRDEL